MDIILILSHYVIISIISIKIANPKENLPAGSLGHKFACRRLSWHVDPDGIGIFKDLDVEKLQCIDVLFPLVG